MNSKENDVEMDEEKAVSSSSDNSDISDDEEENGARIGELQKQIEADVFLYDAHVELIKLLRQSGNLVALRAARLHMSSVYPLTEELWLDWLRDETRIAETEEEKDHVLDLFEKAFKDYLSPGVWLEYVQFCIGFMAEEGGMKKVRSAFEKAIGAIGLHPVKGSIIWEAYREFEHALLSGMQPPPGSVQTADQKEAQTAQMSRVESLFKRQLAIPLLQMQSTMSEYKTWLEDAEVNTQLMQTYNKACSKLQTIVPFENSLSKSKAPHLDEYLAYIDHEVSKGEPQRVLCLYERAIQVNCLTADMWIKYCKYLESVLKAKSLAFETYERAMRNCPWSSALWLGYCRAAERTLHPHEKITDIFGKALASGFSSAADYLHLWTGYLHYMHRRINWQGEHEEELKDLRVVFEKATDFMDTNFPEDGDVTVLLLKYWARVEARFCKNMPKARELWKTVMQTGFGSQAEFWLEYVEIERCYGDHKHCKKIFYQAINSVTDWPESICEAFLRYQSEEGNLEDYDEAAVRCDAQLDRIKERRQKAEEKAQPKKGKAALKNKQVIEQFQKKTKGANIKQEKSPQPIKQEVVRATEADPSFKVPTCPPKTTLAPPPGYKPPKEPANSEGEEPPAKKAKLMDENEDYQYDLSKESCSAFVSNLSYEVTEDRLKEIFSKLGEVTGVRLVKNFKGLSKGFAYVEFKDELLAQKALTLDRMLVNNRPMYVSECNKSRDPSQKFKYATSMEGNKLFVKGLPLVTDKDAVLNIFKEYGAVKDVRIVTHRSGVSKGLAYVDFVAESDAAQAVLRADGLLVGGHEISVAISNPPAHKSQVRPQVDSLGSGKKDFGPRGRAHTQVALMPRALQRKPQATSSSVSSSGDSQTKEKMSNADFRKMLLK